MPNVQLFMNIARLLPFVILKGCKSVENAQIQYEELPCFIQIVLLSTVSQSHTITKKKHSIFNSDHSHHVVPVNRVQFLTLIPVLKDRFILP